MRAPALPHLAAGLSLAWTLSCMRPYRGRMVFLAVIALWNHLGSAAPWPLKVLVDNVLGGRTDARRLWPSPVRALASDASGAAGDRRGRPAAAARVAAGLDGEHAAAGRHRTAHGLFAARKLLAHLQALTLRHHSSTVPPTASIAWRPTPTPSTTSSWARAPAADGRDDALAMFVILLSLDCRWRCCRSVIPSCSLACATTRADVDRAERVKRSSRSSRAALRDSVVDQGDQELRARRHELDRFSRSGDDTMHARLCSPGRSPCSRCWCR